MRDRVVVVAAKAPRAGAVKTRLSPVLTPDAAALLAKAFLADTIRVASHSALRADVVLALDGSDAERAEIGRELGASLTGLTGQIGNSLGDRLVSIVADAFAAGYRSVCVIGSDAPHLPAAFPLEAFGRLARGADVVLGPADDGGYYLIGLSRPAPLLFEEIPWSGPDVLSVTLHRAAGGGLSASLLPPWYDVDTPDDLARLREDLRLGVASAPATGECLEKLTV